MKTWDESPTNVICGVNLENYEAELAFCTICK